MWSVKYKLKIKRNPWLATVTIDSWLDQELFILHGKEVLFGSMIHNHKNGKAFLEFFDHYDYCGTKDCENSKINPPVLLKYKLKALIKKIR